MFAYFILRNPFNTNNVAVDHSAHVGQIPDTIRDKIFSDLQHWENPLTCKKFKRFFNEL